MDNPAVKLVELLNQGLCKRRETGPPAGGTPDIPDEQGPAQSFLGGLDAPPDTAVAHAEFFGRRVDRASSLDGLKDLHAPQAEYNAAGVVFDPYFGANAIGFGRI